ncbi:polysaccharide deacetylase [Desulfovibrio sp. X2]|uniref:polysaccharide deacetylase family protein n=1 Tax=Desulfovibrio sp. X2 TaxID=941449 RepID=UPI000358992B|nr:polysaccharide deacetylase family protein [Desulfovibrio sp. X2]EPR42285.1 polysaccharide deacetylase [Desulfovibrio sp. X2]
MSPSARPAPGRSSVPVLCYHNIGGNGVSEEMFAAQMAWLADRGVRTLRLEELRSVVDGGKGATALDGPRVLLTFDDGFRDLLTRIAPVLRRHGFSAVSFVVPDRVRPEDEEGEDAPIIADRAHEAFVQRGERRAWLSWSELRGLVDEGVLEAGSHSLHHLMFPVSAPSPGPVPDHWAYAPWRGKAEAPRLAPDTAGPLWLAEQGRAETAEEFKARLEENLATSKRILESKLDREVASLAWPWGRWSADGVDAARAAGFDLLFTLERGPLCSGTDASRLPRLEVRRRKGLGWFASRVHIYSRAVLARLYSATRF